jgi:hypothetical protein
LLFILVVLSLLRAGVVLVLVLVLVLSPAQSVISLEVSNVSIICEYAVLIVFDCYVVLPLFIPFVMCVQILTYQ